MDGGNSPRRVVNRLFYFLRFRRPAPRTPQDNAKCNNSRQRARKARRARKRKTRNSTHVWSSNPESEEKRKIVDGDGKREKKVVTGPSVFICSTVAFSFHMYRVSAVDGPSVSILFIFVNSSRATLLLLLSRTSTTLHSVLVHF